VSLSAKHKYDMVYRNNETTKLLHIHADSAGLLNMTFHQYDNEDYHQIKDSLWYGMTVVKETSN